MSWYSDDETVSRWYLELSGDGLDYPEESDEEEEED